MSVLPTGIQRKMYDRVKKFQEFITLADDVADAFIKKSDSIALDVQEMLEDGTYVYVIAQHVFSKLNLASIDRTKVDIETEGDSVISAAPLINDNLNFVGVLVDVPTSGQTLEDVLNTVKFIYQVPDDDASAVAASKTPGAGSSSSAIDLIDDDAEDRSVPPSVPLSKKRKIDSDVSSDASTTPAMSSPIIGGKAKLTNSQILGSAKLKATLDALGNHKTKRIKVSDAVVFKDEFDKFLNMLKLDVLKEVAGRMDIDKNQNKPGLIDDIAGEICQFAINKLNDGRV